EPPARLLVMHAPPRPIHGIEHISPWRYSEAGVCDDDAAALFCLPPRFDLLDVVCGEAGATGDADDLAPAPFAGSTSEPLIATRPARTSAFAWWSLTGNVSPRRHLP